MLTGWRSCGDMLTFSQAVYRSLLHLSWIDKLVDNIRTLFVVLYGDQLRVPNTSVVQVQFDEYFDQQLRELETGAPSRGAPPPISYDDTSEELSDDEPPPIPGLLNRSTPRNNLTSTEASSLPTSGSSRPSTPGVLTARNGPGNKLSRRARKTAAAAHGSSGDEKKKKVAKGSAKKGRKWDADGLADEDSSTLLDYSVNELETPGSRAAVEAVNDESWGSRTGKGQFVLKDLDDQVHSILDKIDEKKADSAAATGLVNSSISAISGLFRNVVGGKTLTKADIDKAMKGMEDHLLKKNVAREAAIRLCEGVERELIGVKTANFESVEARIRTAMEASLRKILTPTTSLDLLREIDAVAHPPANGLVKPRPYVISIVGVNGVGKSTNLSKICFFLLQNKYKVLVVACDTFRSGAVEQLAVHVRNLKELTVREGGVVELYQKGYGKDAAAVGKDAIAFGTDQGFDVVLIDTAGRRHNDARLMGNLEKFAKFAKPDKLLMVGEALVGTDSVAQARNFNAAFGKERKLDGFIISKCDTVGDMIGTLVSMVHASGTPVLFIGVGQHYSDIRSLNVKWAVDKLLSPV